MLIYLVIMIWFSIDFAHDSATAITHHHPSTPLFRRGLAAVGRLGLPHTLSSPLRGGARVWLIHPSINASPSSPPSLLFSSHILSSLMLFLNHTSLLSHTPPSPLRQLTETCFFFKTRITDFVLKISLWQHHSGTISSGWRGLLV